jgi:ABC-type multidrug transport system ATPase subunit
LIYHLTKKVRQERIKDLLNMVGLYDKKDYIVRTFSGGMKRRLEIARGLMHRPKLLILDEPTIGLDPQTRQHIWDYIINLSRQEKITIFFTTHYMDEAENCDRLALIYKGEIIAMGSPSDLKMQCMQETVLRISFCCLASLTDSIWCFRSAPWEIRDSFICLSSEAISAKLLFVISAFASKDEIRSDKSLILPT